MTMNTASAVRSELIKALQADLIGPFLSDEHPGAGEEVLPLPPSRWYLTGFLAPRGGRVPDKDDADSEDEGLAAGGESKDAGTTEPEAKRRQQFPASMGLSAFLPPGPIDGTDFIEVDVSWADYVPEDIFEDRSDKPKRGWKRVPSGPYNVKVPLDDKLLSSDCGVWWPDSTGLCFHGELRTTDMDGLERGTRVLSLFLVNDRQALDRDRGSQSIGPAVLPSLTLLFDECERVFGIVDSLVAIPASWMGRDGSRAVQDADRLQGSGNDEGATRR